MPRSPSDPGSIWKIEGRRVGFVRDGVFVIDRRVHGRRVKKSTGCVDEAAANAEYRKWERDPAHYVPRSGEGATWSKAVPEFLRAQRAESHNSEYWTVQQARHLACIGEYRREGVPIFLTLDGFDASDIRAYLTDRAEGRVGPAKRRGPTGRATRNRELASLKAFLRWARQERLTTNTADTEVPILREGKGRGGALRVVLLGAGLRYGELARMVSRDIHDGAIHVPISKNRDARTVPCSARTVKAARRLLELGGIPDDRGMQKGDRLEVVQASSRRKKVMGPL